LAKFRTNIGVNSGPREGDGKTGEPTTLIELVSPHDSQGVSICKDSDKS